MHWGGGRHHAHSGQAGGFCYVNDVVLAIQYLQQQKRQRVLYLDIDIHHADGVQQAFYETDQVLTVSLHRYAHGFFPSETGSIQQKGRYNTPGVGYNLNLPIPKGCMDSDFLAIYQAALEQLSHAFSPDVIVLCVGADGLQRDPVVTTTDQGWSLTPEGIAECVRITSQHCADASRKLLLLGGGGYDPARTARTFVLCTAAACEGPRPGMLWDELPKDVPRHEYFPRYGPEFQLIGERPVLRDFGSEWSQSQDDYTKVLREAHEAVNLTAIYLESERNKENRGFQFEEDDALLVNSTTKSKAKNGASKRGGRRRRKLKLCEQERNNK
jgi:acetoin utilization deacetylase AcuC-like enzyme